MTAEVTIWLHQHYPILFIVFVTIIATWAFNKYIATKPWVRSEIKEKHEISKNQIMAMRMSHEDLAQKVSELAKINAEVAKQSAQFQASFQTFIDIQMSKR